jgi:hypothetical protein
MKVMILILKGLFNGAGTNNNSQLTAPSNEFNASVSIVYFEGSGTKYYLDEAGERSSVNGGTVQYQFKIDKDGNIEDDLLYQYIKKSNDKFVQRVKPDGSPFISNYSLFAPNDDRKKPIQKL